MQMTVVVVAARSANIEHRWTVRLSGRSLMSVGTMVQDLEVSALATFGRYQLPVTRGDLVLCALPILVFLAIVSLV